MFDSRTTKGISVSAISHEGMIETLAIIDISAWKEGWASEKGEV
jgi:hypothetical protein